MSAVPFRPLEAQASRRTDDRGHLDLLFEQGEVVLKRSFSHAGVFRGMHWQRSPSAQTKIIRVVSGRILDFVMDPSEAAPRLHHRKIGPSDGWVLIGAEWAHGFYALEDTVFEYLCLGAYDEPAEACFSITDVLRDEFGLEPLLSAKDRAAAPVKAILAPAGEGA